MVAAAADAVKTPDEISPFAWFSPRPPDRGRRDAFQHAYVDGFHRARAAASKTYGSPAQPVIAAAGNDDAVFTVVVVVVGTTAEATGAAAVATGVGATVCGRQL